MGKHESAKYVDLRLKVTVKKKEQNIASQKRKQRLY